MLATVGSRDRDQTTVEALLLVVNGAPARRRERRQPWACNFQAGAESTASDVEPTPSGVRALQARTPSAINNAAPTHKPPSQHSQHCDLHAYDSPARFHRPSVIGGASHMKARTSTRNNAGVSAVAATRCFSSTTETRLAFTESPTPCHRRVPEQFSWTAALIGAPPGARGTRCARFVQLTVRRVADRQRARRVAQRVCFAA